MTKNPIFIFIAGFALAWLMRNSGAGANLIGVSPFATAVKFKGYLQQYSGGKYDAAITPDIGTAVNLRIYEV